MSKDELSNTSFGDLELEVMSVLWDGEGPLTVAEVHSTLSAKRELAYTTILTVLGNLYKKQAVDRARKGKAHVYWSRAKRDQAAAGLFQSLLKKVYRNNPAEMLAGFLKLSKPLSSDQIAQLQDELSKLEEELDG